MIFKCSRKGLPDIGYSCSRKGLPDIWYLCSRKGLPDIWYLCSRKGLPDLENKFGITPLFSAAEKGTAAVVKILLRKGIGSIVESIIITLSN